MKNYLKKVLAGLGLACLTMAASVVTPTAVLAVNNQDAVTQEAAKQAQGALKLGGAQQTVVPSTMTSMMVISYTGTAANAYVAIAGSSITFYAPLGTLDTGVNGNGFVDISASTHTLGYVCDLINGVGTFALDGSARGGAVSGSNWHCTLTGGIRSDLPGYLTTQQAVSGINNAAAAGGAVIGSTATVLSLGIIPAPGKHVVLNYCVVNSTGATGQNLQVFGVPSKYGSTDLFGGSVTDSTLVWQSQLTTAGTATVFPLATAIAQPWLEFSPGGVYNYSNAAGFAPGVSSPRGTAYNGKVVVRFDGYSLGYTPAATQYISCNWWEK